MKPILLVADSDAELCDVYRRFLSWHGYEVVIASDGLDCLEKLRQVRPAALVLDFGLRWGGGDGVLAWLRDEGAASEVAVVLTATAGCPRHVAEPPVVRFLPKPFGLTTLLESVAAAVARNEREDLFDLDRSAACPELFIG